ncbi:acetyl-CoA carboxylase carboxyltransferase component [Branchiibius hedensis]|uniref:Acetyl-CoA carboxylase, carboxyltransferase component n=1 Tax=Branchiibius hedensis TaxID=672460 RepID=A0A2Y8ZUJ4_9MICO|nr:acetyl-CoA carboxylase carboxyltransferase component [Branchiibius hedensis]SSA35176.1 Acetyl-CoA carboxylase, carboxyltransferase component [Branchiibius hedensis]
MRIIRSARELGHRTVIVHAADEAETMGVRLADEAVALPGSGPAAYLDFAAIVAAAPEGALVHPGYGFGSENAQFARVCTSSGLVFVGPEASTLELFGDKTRARAAAIAAGLELTPGTGIDPTPDQVRDLLADHPAGVMIKAVAGGGGRGIRQVTDPDQVAEQMQRCAAEAEAGFGDGRIYAEALVTGARHIEVQVVADGRSALSLADRDCSIQRRHQKVVEMAPAPNLPAALRDRMAEGAQRLAESVGYRGVATVEFLVAGDAAYFLEVNPRLQVEHTVTEEVTGSDLVAAQIELAQGARIADLLEHEVLRTEVRGMAIQARLNAETVTPEGEVRATSGTIRSVQWPGGPGVRVDTSAYAGLRHSPRYDSLLAKVICSGPTGVVAQRRLQQALAETDLVGVGTNIAVLQSIVATDELTDGRLGTSWLEDTWSAVAADAAETEPGEHLTLDALEPGQFAIHSVMPGVVAALAMVGGDRPAGSDLAVVEAMKMAHPLTHEGPVRVVRHLVALDEQVEAGQALLVVEPAGDSAADGDRAEVDLDTRRDDLEVVRDRQARLRDDARPEAIARWHAKGRRTARENIADLVDDGSFVEYGGLAIAAQRARRGEQDLIANTPADGLVCGTALINGQAAVVLSYDYTVLAGTQGVRNHAKTDRMLELAHQKRLPVVFFTEGGGGRPGDTDVSGITGLDVGTFRAMGALSGVVPLVGVVSGNCFAGNAALLGVCDVVIATPEASIGMGGPAMIEGGGLGVVRAADVGPVEVQRRNGVVHVVAEDDADAVRVARTYLSYFQGDSKDWAAPDSRLARHAVPQDRMRSYDVHRALAGVLDEGSFLELRADYAPGIRTGLGRVAGAAYGIVANDCRHLGGAIDAPGADKLRDFLRVCDAHGLPIVTFCDTPGFMVGPDAEKDATVTRFGRLFADTAALRVPMGTVILRKAYGLGAMAMAGGSFRAPQFTIAWPTGEMGPMGLEGAVRLGYRKELGAIEDPQQRQEEYDRLVAAAYAQGKAMVAATVFELDDVIDPADTRRWIQTLRG